MPSFGEICPVVLEKKIKILKVYDNDNDGQRINFDQNVKNDVHKKLTDSYTDQKAHMVFKLGFIHVDLLFWE